MGQEIERFLCLLLHLQIYGLYCPLQIRHLDLDLLRVGYWVLFPYVTNFTVTKVIICFQLNLKTEKGCITLLSSKQPLSADPSSHDALQITVSTVQCSNIREFWNFSFCNWKFGLLRRLNKIQRSFQKKNITKAHSIYHNCHLERNLKTKGEGVDQPLPLSVSTSMMGGGGSVGRNNRIITWTTKRNTPALQARINNDTQLDLCLALTWFEITCPITPWLVLNWVLLPFLIMICLS